jgi:hypothetical protein
MIVKDIKKMTVKELAALLEQRRQHHMKVLNGDQRTSKGPVTESNRQD